jgi:primosomal protein N' (replication factor Y)
MPARCPECESPFLRTFQTGTEQVEQEVSLLFPDARIVRMDRDTVAGKDGQLKVLAPFASHEADIMIGTQMIVKGHDFPDVTLVGILMADLSLNIPNYRAAERTFQLLTQAAGRAGRAQRAGAVLIQTFQPSHYAVQCASRQDYDSFYRQEISYREMAGYPPCGSLVAVHMSCADQEHLLLAAGYVKQFLEKILGKAPVQILGPVSEPIAKIADVWRQVIYLKGGSSALLRAARNRLERYIELNDGFSTVEITFDSTI